ncbi:unnamed protein product [Cuscuta europaea]|uniref:Uncharacterized protein n=1 Tax=Cuscuta europaea TaxID=41803 RepID=A0A9P1EF34_CUSEU|nr:unnamed protein product [Cuscuta europaea]
MGRGKGKGKKHSAHEDMGSGEEGKMQPVRRRGRPQKLVKDVMIEGKDGVDKLIEEGNTDDKNNNILIKGITDQNNAENEKKRKLSSPENENGVLTEEEKGLGIQNSASELVNKSVGFRQIGSRRKSKPRRAAEVGVECR